jgi:hypothetical protein
MDIAGYVSKTERYMTKNKKIIGLISDTWRI